MADFIDKTKRKNFKWDHNMVENLINCAISYKARMLYKNLDFDADKVGLYREVRLSMAEIYNKNEEFYFGPVAIDTLNEKDSKEVIKRGIKRVQEKLKEIRQKFSKAVVSGSRSGSGKIIFEFYDQLISLWGSSANIEPLIFGVKGDDFIETEETHFSIDQDLSEEVELVNNSDTAESINNPKKRKSCVPQLIDNKRKHLERNLSAAQRDQLLLKEARDDAQFRKEMAEAMRESTKCFTESINTVSKSMTDLGNGISRSIELLAQAMIVQTQQQSSNQNQFYQHSPNVYSQMQFSPLVLPTNTCLDKITFENIEKK
ncbi:uncharacterized protein LOC136089562 [Hydra vulgaris]|uniref:Uncharacterized protein LOC136089562 n=1 Tax=Hydra vulgaris TaxID=6087 RepID=A0ABM4DBE5_HYDVU